MRILKKMTINPATHPAVNAIVPLTEGLLDSIHNYGMSSEQSFGWWANRYSAAMALSCNSDDIEELASAVHDGWSKCFTDVDDPVTYANKPGKRQNRMQLANTPYEELDEKEKQKDRQVAYVIAAYLRGMQA